MTLGSVSARRRCRRARAPRRRRCGPGRRRSGAPSSRGPSGKTAKKLGSKRAHSTSRRLVTRARRREALDVPDDLVPDGNAQLARDPRVEREGNGRRCGGRRCCPPFARLPQGARHYALGSRRFVAVGGPVLAPQRPAVPHRLRVAGSGQPIRSPQALDGLDAHGHDRHRRGRGSPAFVEGRDHGLGWSGWMSKRAMLGRAGPASTRRSRSRLCWSSTSVPRRNAPKPRASTTVTVWLAGR